LRHWRRGKHIEFRHEGRDGFDPLLPNFILAMFFDCIAKIRITLKPLVAEAIEDNFARNPNLKHHK
jgi:hypothetical protein